ncbi:hypothetical protein RB195_004490 [Necator americanus]|uniref:Uncharacterized protein n=2 Tax=Necator americanus TaxID=51031 RepID=W2TNB7_NECAM|nr:hypothetical protein NECAME_07484 [Necator americanus]ETN83248.1 hypothetical protein NECAME_07484 [Necator americanus]
MGNDSDANKEKEKDSKGKRKVTIATKDSYTRVTTISNTTDKPNTQTKPTMEDIPQSPIQNPQVHNIHTTVDNKIVDGKYVRTETQVEEARKEDMKQHVEAIKQ